MAKTALHWLLFLFLAGSGILLVVALFCEIAFLFRSEERDDDMSTWV